MNTISVGKAMSRNFFLDQGLSEKVTSWTLSLEERASGKSGFRFSETATQTSIMSTAMAVLVFELFRKLPVPDQELWKAFLLSAQDSETGLFLDPLLTPADLKTGSPGEEYIHHQTTYFALHALDALNSHSSSPLSFTQPYMEKAHMEKWLESLDWTKPWFSSNWIMFLASAIIFQGLVDSSVTHLSWINHLLDWLDAHQDSQTGFWGSLPGVPAEHAMAAAYHFLPFYLWAGRRFRFAEQIIDSTLSLQGEDGLFHSSKGGDSCLDVDALDILVKCMQLTDHRSEVVEKAVDRIFIGLADNQDEAGGFCRARFRPVPPKSRKRKLAEFFLVDKLLNRPFRPGKETWRYSGWSLMPYEIHRGDLWSTWFRGYGLGLICKTFPQKYPSTIEWKFRRLPALGWHNLEDIARVIAA